MDPIAYVSNGRHTVPAAGWRTVVSEVWFCPGMVEHRTGLEEFSHFYVLFWMHHHTSRLRERSKVHPRGREDVPLVGVFATHSPFRPNPIGLTIVERVHFCGDSIWVRGLDALDGSPVLDIKSYVPFRNERTGVTYPEWVHRLWNEG